MKRKEATKVIRLLRDGLTGLHIAHDMDLSAYEVCMIEEAWKEVDLVEKKKGELGAKERYRMIGKYLLLKDVSISEVAEILGTSGNTVLSWELDNRSEKWITEIRKEDYEKRKANRRTCVSGCVFSGNITTGNAAGIWAKH